MCCESVFRTIVLAAMLMGVVSCQEAGQQSAALVASEESVLAKPELVVAPVTAPESATSKIPQAPAEVESASEHPSDVEAGQSGPAEEVIASYGDKKLTRRDIDYLQPKADDKIIKQIGNWWIETQLLAEEAVKRGIDEDPAVRLRASLRAQQEYAEGLNKHVRDAVGVSEDQMREYYGQNKETDLRINEPPKLSFTHVASKTLEQSQAILDRVEAGEDIAALAKELSIDYDKRKSGAAKNVTEPNIKRRFGADFLNAILQATEGDIIGPVKVMVGRGKGERYEVARLDGKVPGRMKSFEEVEDYIKTKVERTGKQKAVEELLKSLEEKASDKIFRSEQILEEEPAKKVPIKQ